MLWSTTKDFVYRRVGRNDLLAVFATNEYGLASVRKISILTVLTLVCRFGLAALFLFAVVAKLAYLNHPEHSFFRNLPLLVGERWAWSVGIGVITAEALTAMLLIVPRTARWGGALAALLLTAFAGYALYYRFGLHNAEGLECGCFGGIIASQLGVSTALRNLSLLIPAGLVIWAPGKLKRPEPQFEIPADGKMPDAL